MPAFQHDLAYGATCFELSVRLTQIGSIDGGDGFIERGLQHALIHQFGNAVEDMVLFCHVGGLIHGTCKHQLPCEGRALILEQIKVHRLCGFDNRANLALRLDELGHDRKIAIGIIAAENIIWLGNANFAHLRHQVMLMIDDVLCAQFLHPPYGLRPRCRGYHGQSRQFVRELDCNRTHAARTTYDEQALIAVLRYIKRNAQPVE